MLPYVDPTLVAVDMAIEANARREPPREYLGMSQIGAECERQLFFSFRLASVPQNFDAKSLRRFDDGHYSESVMARRLRAVRGVELHTVDPATGEQFRHADIGGHFSGHMDGAITGLIQMPDDWLVWEHKAVGDDNYKALTKLREKWEPGSLLLAWNSTYYAQAVLYMDYAGLPKHYTTVDLSGSRETQSIITEANPILAAELKAKAHKIIEANLLPERISDDPTFWKCKGCAQADVCHGYAMPEVNCRTCTHSAPDIKNGGWYCEQHKKHLTFAEQLAGCNQHTYLYTLLEPYGFTAIDADEGGVTYLTKGMNKITIGPGPNAMPSLSAKNITPLIADQLIEKAAQMHATIGDPNEHLPANTAVARADEIVNLDRQYAYNELSAAKKKALDRGEVKFEKEDGRWIVRNITTGEIVK